MTRRLFAVGTLVCILLGTSITRGQPAGESAEAAAARAEGSAKEAALARDRILAESDRTLLEARRLLAETRERSEDVDWYASWTIEFFGLLFTLLGFAAALGVIATLADYRKVRAAKASVLQLRSDLEKHQLFLGTLNQEILRALKDIESRLDIALTPETGIIGVAISTGIPHRLFDDDALIVFADRLQIASAQFEPARLSAFLVKIATYWRRYNEYSRATERLRRAIELDPASPGAHKGYARALWNSVGHDIAVLQLKVPSEAHHRLLQDALVSLETARSLLKEADRDDEEIYYDSATIKRLLGDVGGSEIDYQTGSDLSIAKASARGREPDWDFRFALACLLANSGKFDEALEHLNTVLDKKQSWSQTLGRAEERNYVAWVQSDPDFKKMWADESAGPQLKRLLERKSA